MGDTAPASPLMTEGESPDMEELSSKLSELLGRINLIQERL